MSSPRWRKAIRDLWQNRTRTFLVVLALVIGVSGFGSVLSTYSILMRELNVNYLATHPAAATIWTDPLDDDFIAAVRQFPGIGDAEGRRWVIGRMMVGPNEWRSIWLFVIRDFQDLRVGTFEPEQGAWPPAAGEILLERQAFKVGRARIGDMATIKTPNGTAKPLRISGSVHDLGQAPAGMENLVYGYITLDTLAQLGEAPYLDQLKITVAENALDQQHIRSTTFQLKDWIEKSGRQVYRIEVPRPGKHPHADQMNALLLFQASFGLLAFLLGAVLVVNMVAALMAGQVRQIGVMKALGARGEQVMGIYFGTVLLLGLVALAVALPAGVGLGKVFARFYADGLNFDIVSDAIPLWVFVLEVAVGLLVPLLAAAYPIYKGSRIPVQQALGDYGVGPGTFGMSPLDRLLGRISGLARPLLLSIRNTFRRRGRLALTLGTLAAGGMIFMAALNVRASLLNTIDVMFSSVKSDIILSLSRPYPIAQIEAAVRNTPGVLQVESWGKAETALVYADGTDGNRVNIVAPPAGTRLIEFAIIEGRGLRPDDRNALVINNRLSRGEPTMKVGSEVVLRVAGKKTRWQVVGVARQAFLGPAAYANSAYLADLTGQAGYARDVMIVMEDHDAAALNVVKRSLEQNLEGAGLEVLSNNSMADTRMVIEEHMVVIVTFFMAMALLIVVVGGLGLMTTMSINVLERRREIGVLRAIGASNRAVFGIIVVEGSLIGVLSWLVASLLAWPVSVSLGNVVTTIMLETTMDFSFAPLALLVWLILVVLFAAIASFSPARSAARLTVREAVGYE